MNDSQTQDRLGGVSNGEQRAQLVLLDGQVHVPHAYILSQCYAKPDDIVLAAGTLVEGIGNQYSDIDAYVVTDRLRRPSEILPGEHHRVIGKSRSIIHSALDDELIYIIHTVVPGTGIKVDVEYITFEDVNSLLDRVSEIFQYAISHPILLTKYLSEREENLMHRFFNQVSLQNGDRLNNLLARVPKAHYAYLAYRWNASDFSVLLDLMGAWSAGELDRAVDLARENLLTQMAAYIALQGVTNLRRKWLLTYLERLPPEDSDLRADFMSHFYLEGASTEAGKRAFVESSLDLVDRIYGRSSPRLAEIPGAPSGAAGLERLERNHALVGDQTHYAELELEYRAKVYGRPGRPSREFLGSFGAARRPQTAPASR
ncbi:MAG: hypothetical protein Q8Q88_01190 [Phenylobacterium sp.]|uniref:hypothetical protein n=1 Tax=Phenylobacterium sp. TaxID=1871053 RepID=UPI0027367692|nr:hypothetical protein [Phenylobacterium sp.]MDP3745639.1 hypothetical protein [Phenylobacterium sp.]